MLRHQKARNQLKSQQVALLRAPKRRATDRPRWAEGPSEGKKAEGGASASAQGFQDSHIMSSSLANTSPAIARQPVQGWVQSKLTCLSCFYAWDVAF
eukprot:6466097-Amphidinium_carterae.2